MESDVKLTNKDKTLEKVSGNKWYTVLGKNVLKQGIYNWTVTVDHYPSSDWSGLIVGVVEVAE